MYDYKNMYGEMTEDEIGLIYNHIGNYKGWKCIYTGCGTVIMNNGFNELRTFRDESIKNWIPECWKELKSKIDNYNSIKNL